MWWRRFIFCSKHFLLGFLGLSCGLLLEEAYANPIQAPNALALRVDFRVRKALMEASAESGCKDGLPCDVSADAADSKRRIPVFVADPIGASGLDADAWQKLDWRFVWAQLSDVARWADAGAILRFAATHRPFLERSLLEIGLGGLQDDFVPQVQPLSADGALEASEPTDGSGVLIGIVDTGIDLSHPAFTRLGGGSRIVAVWDQNGSGLTPKKADLGEQDYGLLCTQKVIESETCPLKDPLGHGTHVAGIAAGSGLVQGVAPGADLAMVRSDQFTRLADAINFLLGLAKRRHQPVVINLSVGGQYGPHDGQTPLEIFVDRRLGPGRLMVVAAGNDGGQKQHLGIDLDRDWQRSAWLGAFAAGAGPSRAEFWHTANADATFGLEYWDLDGNQMLQERIVWRDADTDVQLDTFAVGVNRMRTVRWTREYLPEHKRFRVEIAIGPEQAISTNGDTSLPELLPGLFVVAAKGSGRVDAWLQHDTAANVKVRFGVPLLFADPQALKLQSSGWLSGDSRHTIAVPATAASVVSVGSYTVASTWSSAVFGEQALGFAPLGELASYSSKGPAIDPAHAGTKPDVVAPGGVIISARAQSAPSGPQIVDTHRQAMQGTSMAAPHVTGVLALALQRRPDLDPKHAREMIAASARQDAAVGLNTPNAEWGHGKLNAEAALAWLEAADWGCQGGALGDGGVAALFLCLLTRHLRRKWKPNEV